MKLIYALSILAAACALPALAPAQKASAHEPEKIQLELKSHSRDAEAVALLVKGIGRVETRQDHVFIIELKDGLDADRVAEMLSAKPGVKKAKVLEDEEEEREREQKERGERRPNNIRESGPEKFGIRDATKFWYEQRAYPNNAIDRNAYVAAAKHRDLMMPPAKLINPIDTATKTSAAPIAPNTWTFLGPKNMGAGQDPTTPWSGRVNGIAYVPGNSNAFYIATSSGGIWKTTDAGVNWTPLSDTWPFMYSTCVKVHPTVTSIIYAGSGDFDSDYSGNGVTFGCGLMKSTNGGTTWTALGIAQGFANYSISDIIIDPENPSIVTISEGRGRADTSFTGAGYIWRTTDGGGTWTKVVNVNKSWSKLACSAISGGVRYYWAISQDGVTYRSADRGATWIPITTPIAGGSFYIDRITAHPTQQQTAYILDSNNEKIYKTGNAGTSWIDVTNNLLSTNDFGQNWYDAYIGVSSVGGNDHVYMGGIDVSLSVNGGGSWTQVGEVYGFSPKLHPDQHCIVFDPADPTSGLIGCDGGIWHFHYDTGTSTFSCTSLNANLGLTELYHLDIHPTNANIVLSGAQDNSTQYSRNGILSTWELEIGGDGGYCGINPSNTQVQYGSYVYGNLYQTNDEWVANLSEIQALDSFGTSFIAPFVLDPNNGNILYSTNEFGLNKYNATTATWSNKLGGVNLTSNYILAIAVCPSNSNKIYTGAVDGQVWMTANGGTSWTQINAGSASLPNRAVTSIAVDPTNSEDVLVGLSGTGTGHLYRCTNPSIGATRVWTNVSGTGSTLPDIPLDCIARDPDIAGQWFVGTDAGVFMTTDSGANWSNASNPLGFPNVHTNALKIRKSDRMMYAATWGRGVWRIQIPFPGVVKSVAVNPTAVPSGTNSTGTVTLWAAAPVGGTTVNLSSNNAAAVVPSTVTVLAGATTATFPITTSNATYAVINATITQSFGAESNHTAVLAVRPSNYSQFIGQTVPASMTAGQSYAVSLQFKNTGLITWDTAHGYKLESANPYNNTTWGFNRLALTSGAVAPGATGTFSGTVIAPASTATYNFQWQMVEEGVSTFGPLSTNLAIPVTKVADAARFISKTGPTTVNAGADFAATFTMMNVGTNTWTTAAYTLRPVFNNWNVASIAPAANVAPNAQTTFSRTLMAPITPGTYQYQWQMYKAAFFGDKTPYMTIVVSLGADDAQFVSETAISNSIAPSATFGATFTMKNLGTGAWSAATHSLAAIGSNNFGIASIASGAVTQNNNGTFTATFTAPATPGTYTFQMRMQHTATKFGQATTLHTIVVSADAAQYISRTGPSTVNAGADFFVQNTMKNTGSTSWTGAAGYYMMSQTPANNTTWTLNKLFLPGAGPFGPGSSVTFTGKCTAPITPATYTMQWQMSKSGVAFGEKSPLINIVVTAGPDNAQFVSQTGVPTTIVHGTTFNATITMKNIGSATWDGTYSLASVGSNTFGIASIVATSTAPNANKAFTATFTAPATPGTYTFQMRMQHTSTKFGQPGTLVTITVT